MSFLCNSLELHILDQDIKGSKDARTVVFLHIMPLNLDPPVADPSERLQHLKDSLDAIRVVADSTFIEVYIQYFLKEQQKRQDARRN